LQEFFWCWDWVREQCLPMMDGATGATFGMMKSGSRGSGGSCGVICIAESMVRRGMSGESCGENTGM